MHERPFAALSHPNCDRLHERAAVGLAIAWLYVQMNAVQAVWTMVAMLAAGAGFHDRHAAVSANEPVFPILRVPSISADGMPSFMLQVRIRWLLRARTPSRGAVAPRRRVLGSLRPIAGTRLALFDGMAEAGDDGSRSIHHCHSSDQAGIQCPAHGSYPNGASVMCARKPLVS